MTVKMAGRTIVFIGFLHLSLLTYSQAKSSSYLSCTSAYHGDFVLLDCYYRGGLPFPTLTWSGPHDLYRTTTNTPRFIVNISREEFVNKWDTIYKCKAKYRYSSSYCYVGRGIGSFVGIAFGVLALLFLLCILSICMCQACKKLVAAIRRRQGNRQTLVTDTAAGYDNPTFVSEPAQAKAPE